MSYNSPEPTRHLPRQSGLPDSPAPSNPYQVEPSSQSRWHLGVNLPRYASNVAAVASTMSVLGFFFGWVLDAASRRISDSGGLQYGPLNYTYYAVFGGFAVIVVAAVWLLLQMATDIPNTLFHVVTGGVLLCSVVLSLLLVAPLINAIVQALMFAVLGVTSIFLVTLISKAPTVNGNDDIVAAYGRTYH